MGWGGKAGLVAALAVLISALDVVANVVGLAESSALVSVAEWLYPVGVLALAGALIVALTVTLLVKNRAAPAPPDPEREAQALERQREHDQEILRQIRETLPRPYVTDFLRHHDFGAAWRVEQMFPISELRHRNNVEDRFLDEELEALRVQLHEAVAELNHLFNVETFPQENQQGYEWQDVGVRPLGPSDRETEIWEQRQRQLNETADRVADAFDALVERARQKMLL